MDFIARQIGRAKFGRLKFATDDQIKDMLTQASQDITESQFTRTLFGMRGTMWCHYSMGMN